MSDWLQSVICACKSGRADSPSMHYRTLMKESSLYSRLPCLESIHLFLTYPDMVEYTATTYVPVYQFGWHGEPSQGLEVINRQSGR